MRHRFAWTLLGTSLFVATTALAQTVLAQPAPVQPPPPPPSSGPAGTVAPPGAAQPPFAQPLPPPPNGTTPVPPGPAPQPPDNTSPPGPLPPGGPVAPGLPPPGLPPPGLPPSGPLPPGQLPPGQPPPGMPGGPVPPGPGAQGPWVPPPPPDVAELPGTKHGMPLARRGVISVEAAGYTATQPDPTSLDTVIALALNVHIPIATRTFADVRVPMAGYLPGNIMLGADRVSKLDPKGFLAYGLQIGLPLSVNRGLESFSLPNGTWNVHEYQPRFMPFKLAFGYERMMGESFTARVDLEPILSVPVGDYGYNVGFTFQHAAEIQYGHGLGVGLRVQGVAISDQLSVDAYQFAIEPFAVVRRDMGFARLGLMLPIDDSTAGPPFEQAWGLRLWTGLHID